MPKASSVSFEDQAYMQRTIALARESVLSGNRPFAALLAGTDEMLLETVNTVAENGDVTQHAELRLISEASRRFTRVALSEATLYSSTEPCEMCSGAIYRAGIRRVVYACPAEVLASMTGSDFVIGCRDIFERGTLEIEVIGPIMAKEAELIHRDFWVKD